MRIGREDRRYKRWKDKMREGSSLVVGFVNSRSMDCGELFRLLRGTLGVEEGIEWVLEIDGREIYMK
jgi:hypothetical protein